MTSRLPSSNDINKWKNTLHNGECLQVMSKIPEKSIDLILADLPYGTTRNKWDSVIPLEDLWASYERILKSDGCIILTSAQPFTSQLVMSNPDWFRYEWIWEKTISSGQLNSKIQPMRNHESVLVFAPKKPKYFPIMTEGTPYKINRKAKDWSGHGYNDQSDHVSVNSGTRFPKTVLKIANPRIKNGHPTQKPLELFEYLIKTYTEEDSIVLDNVIGSGTTAIAALNTKRYFIGIEMDKTFYDESKQRIKATKKQRSLRDKGKR